MIPTNPYVLAVILSIALVWGVIQVGAVQRVNHAICHVVTFGQKCKAPEPPPVDVTPATEPDAK